MTTPTMIGTTGTTFTVVGVFPAGHIGFRDIGSGQFRVRIAEYKDKESLSDLLPSWNQPNENDSRTRRFSTVVNGAEGLGEAISTGAKALTIASKDVVDDSLAELEEARDAAQAALDAAEAAYESALAFQY